MNRKLLKIGGLLIKGLVTLGMFWIGVAVSAPDLNQLTGKDSCKFKNDDFVIEVQSADDKVQRDIVRIATMRMGCNFKKGSSSHLSREAHLKEGPSIEYVETTN